MKDLIRSVATKSLLLILIVLSHEGYAETEDFSATFQFESSDTQTTLIELYTSQGCSSCPPAETKLNSLVDDPGLWTEYIPIAFHVDYWDRLGWKDPFANRSHTERQYALKASKQLASVYTPAFVINGKEWRGYFRGENWPENSRELSGRLSVSIQNRKLLLSHPALESNTRSYVAIVGVGFETDIKTGENRNRKLQQDFVVLWYRENLDNHTATLPKLSNLPKAHRYACIAWVADGASGKPIQVAASWIP